MQTIKEISQHTYEIKKSKFIAYLIPISKFEGFQDKLRQEHPKSRHVVYALRYLNEFEQIVENSSDDGEPKGSSAPPALNVLRGEDMINVAVLIVRYFGGIKLGIGGLVRAYGNAVKEVIANSNVVLYEKMLDFHFNTTYSEIQKIEYILNKIGITQIEREFLNDGVAWDIKSTEKKLEEFKEKRQCMR
ncbi:FIG000605: protein co-occurring with transport systems (COG1739) [hydrothermal vent metagenome]|uniref:FIG000605: protein co-occurring with transport systems (COG1739) n=1 Tax=hydrothermal vent metagenome TaxID=652676 RepID=A0A1W1BXA5_9ZZZZ